MSGPRPAGGPAEGAARQAWATLEDAIIIIIRQIIIVIIILVSIVTVIVMRIRRPNMLHHN